MEQLNFVLPVSLTAFAVHTLTVLVVTAIQPRDLAAKVHSISADAESGPMLTEPIGVRAVQEPGSPGVAIRVAFITGEGKSPEDEAGTAEEARRAQETRSATIDPPAES